MIIKKTRVLQVCGRLSPEGIGVFLLNMMENIDVKKCDITFALATKYPQSYEERIKTAGGTIVRTYELGEGLKGKILHFFSLLKILKSERYDVVHTHMDFFNGVNLLAASLAGVKKRISHAHIAKKPQRSLTEMAYHFVMHGLIKIFATHRVGCSVINRNINGSGIVIYNGIDIQKFSGFNEFPSDIVLNKQKKNLITVGRMDAQKNPFFIVEKLRELSLIEKNFHFYWVGSGSLEKDIKLLIEQYVLGGYITFLKNRHDVAGLLQHMNLFLFPSLFEGLPIVLIEAQISNVECIVSTNITREVDLGLCTYLDLGVGESVWANEIQRILVNSKITCIDVERLTNFNVKFSVEKLQRLYTEI